MELWTEYEGRTIDGAFPLKRLLLPEGRSAFFSTSNGKGAPTVIRLIACHFDEEEILARWRGIEALNHPNIVKLERYGQLVMDDTTVVYAVIEQVDANLAEVVSGQRLTVSEATQLAASLTSALDVMHTNGFVHEHVEPANIFAVGEVVKLRGDCIREAPEGERGVEAKKRDVRDVAVVLLQALTQQRTLQAAAGQLPLPAPFDQIVRKGLQGEWGIAEMRAALHTAPRPTGSSSAVALPPKPAAVSQPAAAAPKAAPSPKPVPPEPKTVRVPPPAPRIPFPVEDPVRKPALDTRWIVAAGLAVILFVWLGWHLAHSRSASHNSARQATSTPASTRARAGHSGAPAATGAPAAGANFRQAQSDAASETHAQWRVVAYTYNHQDQAQKKSSAVAHSHPELRPEVFAPSGHAPYLVTVGGVMNRDQAVAFVRKARNLGLPRDTYAQNYSGKPRPGKR